MVAASQFLQIPWGLFFPQSTNLTALFGPVLSPNAQILYPNNGSWASQVQPRWSDYKAPKYQAAIKPVTEEDIQNIINVARDNEIPFLTTGGGHSTADFSAFDGISIDLGNFKSASLDESHSLLTVGGATEFSDVYKLLYDARKELLMTVGSCACPGIVGSALAAGISPLMGIRGLLLDALESVRMVTADGKLVTASRTQNSGLFWALRGAGNNFGVVTSATFKVYDATNDAQAMVATMIFPAVANKSFWEVLQSFDENLPPGLAITALGFYYRQFNMPIVAFNAIFYGPQAEGEAYLEPFAKLGSINTTIQMMPQKDLFPPVMGSCDTGQHINVYSLAATRIDPEALEAAYADMYNMWQKHDGYQGRLLIQRFSNDAVRRIPSHESAYPWRDAIAHIIEGFMTDVSIYDAVDEFESALRSRLVKTSGYPRLATYAGYAKGTEAAHALYGSSLAKLLTLKNEWDPKGLFSHSKPIQ